MLRPKLAKANGAKENFRKFMESILQKQGKVRNLVNDLKKHYVQDDLVTQSPSYTAVVVGESSFQIISDT